LVRDEVQHTKPGSRVATLFYIHDPMCSWCWGFRPVFDTLCRSLPSGVEVSRLLGGLAPDSDEAMSPAMRETLQDTWRRIAARIPGTRFNHDFWTRCQPRRSTWPACRAVIAARNLVPAAEQPMILAIQRAYYLEARNPSDRQTLITLAAGLGIDASLFADTLDSMETRTRLAHEMQLSHALGATGFPSLRLRTGKAIRPITVDYHDAGSMQSAIARLIKA
jgi:putative protein-disulfide isomerase